MVKYFVQYNKDFLFIEMNTVQKDITGMLQAHIPISYTRGLHQVSLGSVGCAGPYLFVDILRQDNNMVVTCS